MRAFTTFLILFLTAVLFFDSKAELVNVSGYVVDNNNSSPISGQAVIVSIKNPNSALIFQEKLYTDTQGFYNYTFKVPYSFGIISITTIDCDNQIQTVNDYFSPMQLNIVANFFICFEPGMFFCHADFIYSTNPYFEKQVLFRHRTFGDIVFFNWDFGDGNTSDLPNPVHIFELPGIYEVCLGISDITGNCIDVSCQTIEILTEIMDCNAEFMYFPIPGAPATCEFIDVSSPEITSWEWNFGDGNISNIQNPVHTFKSPGTYLVCLTIESSIYGCDDSWCQEVIISTSGSCNADFDYAEINGNPLNISFNDLSTGNPDSWSWSFGDGTTSNHQSPVHQYENPGIYEVCLLIYNSATGCSHEYCKIVLLLEEPYCNAYFSYFKLAIDPVTFQFADMSLGNISNYHWDFGDGYYSTLPNPVHSYFEAGVYEVCLTIAGLDGCEDTHCEMVFAEGSPGCEAGFDYLVNFENYRQIGFLDNSVGEYNQWLWDFSDGTFSTEKNPLHTFENDGMYLVCLTVSDSTNSQCMDEICKYVLISEDFYCKVQFSHFPVPDEPNKIQFANQSSGNLDYWIWDFGDGSYSNDQNPLHVFEEDGEYRVCLLAIDINGFCWDAECKIIQITNTTQLAAGFNYSISSDNPFLVQFIDNSSGDVATWIWDFGDGNTSGQQNPQHIYENEGAFEVCLTVINAQGNQSSTNCDILAIEAPDLCFADFDIQMIEGEVLAYQFFDLSQGIANRWEWNFGDGAISALQNPLHFYQDSGSYIVQFKIFNSDSLAFCWDSIQKEIYVSAPAPYCKANFTVSIDSSVNMPRYFHFQDLSENNPDEWFWDFGDGKFSFEQNPSHQFDADGDFMVQLTVTKNNLFGENCTDTKSITISTPEYFHIGGFVYTGSYPINNPIHTGDTAIIYLYRHHGFDKIFCIDTAIFTTNGYYFALYLLEDHYLIKARLTPHSINARKYFPAYFGNRLLWQDTPAYFLTQTHQYNLDIHLPPLLERPKGTGLISGSVSYHFANKGNLPGNDAQVLLFDETNTPVDYVFSNNEGIFGFESLPFGTYKILAESTGLFTEPVFITLSAENPVVSDLQLMLYPFDITGISDLTHSKNQKFIIYPNPVNDVLNIQVIDQKATPVEYQVVSISGVKILEGEFSQSLNQQLYQINTANLAGGVYLLRIKSDKQFHWVTLKFIK